MLSSKFLNSEEMQKLDIKHGLEGCGAIMFIFEYLVDRTNGLGSYISVPSLARSMGKNKKFLLDSSKKVPFLFFHVLTIVIQNSMDYLLKLFLIDN